MTALFFIMLLPLCALMKVAAFWNFPEARKDWALMLSPFPSPAALKEALPRSAGPRLIGRSLVAFAACAGAYWLCWSFFGEGRLPLALLSYAGAFVLWLVSEALGSLVPFMSWHSGWLLPLPHGAAPPLARGLSDFWGRRWNRWTSQWLHQIIFCPLQRRPVIALFEVFVVSGLLHEWVINFPLYLVTGKNCFGLMTLYFGLQAVGILVERKTRSRAVRVLLVWVFVFGAAPLMVNEGLLRILHLWPE